MKRIFAFVFIMVLYSKADVFAEKINLEQARLLALASSRSLAKYELNMRSSILDEKNQFYSMLPSVSAGYSASSEYFRDGKFSSPVDTLSARTELSITQIIFQGGKSFIQKALSSIATESVRKDALAEYFKVLDSVDNAYYAVLEAVAALEAEESSLESANFNLQIAEIRMMNGIVNQGDYLRTLADKEARENSRNQARRNLLLSMTKFKNLTGITGNIEFEQIDFSVYEDILVFLSGISDERADLIYEAIWEILASSNPSLSKAALNNIRAEKNLSLAWTDFSPVVSATVFSTGLNYTKANGFGTTSSGGLTIRGSIPVDFWVISNRIEKSKIARDSAALDYINAEVSLEMELQSALLNTFAQAGTVLSSGRSLEYTEGHYEIVMERFRLSQSSVSDASEAATLLINSRNSHIRARYGFLQSLSKLRSLCALEDEEKLLNILTGRGDFL
jgi:outer membrane protein TolC